MRRTKREVQPTPTFGSLRFGMVVPCDRCRTTGTFIAPDGKKSPCSQCEARGYHEWRTNAVARDSGSSA